MAEIKPFRGWRYNQDTIEDICELTSPLFDVATEKQKSALYCNPCNSIHLSIPAGDQPARNALEAFTKWQAEGTIRRDPEPGIYVYYQYYKLPGDPTEYCRKGFICKIRIYDWEENVIIRHENTMPGSVKDQVDLLATTRLNVSPTHGLYTDNSHELEKYMDLSMQNPLCEAAEDYQGIRDVMGVIHDPDIIARFVDTIRDKQVIMADGHHRYAGSLAYMKQKMSINPDHTGSENYNFHLMWLTNTEAQDLKILPTHRLIKGLDDFDEASLVKRFEKDFIVKSVADTTEIMEVITGKKWTFGVIFNENAYRVRLKPEAFSTCTWRFPPEILSLDLTVMHYFIIQKILGIKGSEQSQSDCIAYSRSFPECLMQIYKGEAQMALVLNELSIDDIKKVCSRGSTMPPKSSFFWPKVICGFVFSSI